jgi:biotin carboxylase
MTDWAGAVVLLRDYSYKWVARVAEMVRASGSRPVLVTGPIDEAQRRLMAAVVDDVAVTADPYDAAGVAATIREHSIGGAVAGVISLSDAAIPVAARAAELIGLRRAPAKALALARNKYGARLAMRDAGLPVPGFALLHDAEHAAAVAA